MGIEFTVDKHIARVGINIPETRNALSPDILLDLSRIWERCQSDYDIRVIVLYSCLPDIFCSGMDLKTAIPVLTGARKPETEGERWIISFNDSVGKAMLKYKDLDRPVIAAVNGYCLTGGFEMIMGCELRVASEDARFQMRETTLGIMPVGGSNVFLPLQVGMTRALEILLTGENFSAQTLCEWGFLNRVVPKDRLMDEAMALAERIASNGPRSIRGMVRLSRIVPGLGLEEAFKKEVEIGMPIFASDEAREGIMAQREKRKPRF
ncbi:MAG: enoyl-CoA hydratase/isomerase family protein [Deltaproteobacteria bacterium]|nr:enoyl-CoA hydratase/isomerase family protein [Deltaproteobacteria bacterium]